MKSDVRDIADVFVRGEPEEIATGLANEHPADLAAALQALGQQQALRVLRQTDRARQAAVFGYLDHDFQTLLAAVISREELAEIIVEMDSDDRADLYKVLTNEQREALERALAQAEREDIRQLASYQEGTAGAIMTSDYVAFLPDLNATQALNLLRREAPDKETIYRTYVIDQNRTLLGSVRLRDLITASAESMIADIMETSTHAVGVDDDVEEVARRIAHYDVIALPVVDESDHLVGIITHDDAFDVVEAEATEDFHRAGTVTNLESSVKTATIAMLYRARIAWLMLLVFGNIFSGAGIAYFEETIAAHLALMFFLPILIASGGNAGSQSATLMVRALATGDIAISDWSRMLGREFLVAIMLGASMACAIALIGIFRGGPEIALVISLSMILVVIVGSLIGMLLPFVLSRLKLDPATASTPLVTSIADATGVLIYFSIASAVLVIP